MKLILFLLSTSCLWWQGTTTHRWTCTSYYVNINGIDHHPTIVLEIQTQGKSARGKLKLIEEGKIKRISEIVGVVYGDGSASLAERWVDQEEPGWLPAFNSLLITDIGSSSFRLNFNSASSGRAFQEKGEMLFQKVAIGAGS